MEGLSVKEILRLFDLLNEELKSIDIKGELNLVGGAVMCLVYDARASTNDIDALFKPSRDIREAAEKIAVQYGYDTSWLNDAVKGYLSHNSDFEKYLELSNLNVYTASPEYLLAMKCLSMRIGEGFEDENDVRYLLRYLNIEKYEQAIEIITKYYPKEGFPQKTFYALEEILGND